MKDKTNLHIVLNSVISTLVAVLFVFYVIFAVDFVKAVTAEEQNLATGIGAAVCIVFMFVIDAAEAFFGASGAVYSSLVKKQMPSGARTAVTVFMLVDIVLPALAIFSSAVLFILNNSGAFL